MCLFIFAFIFWGVGKCVFAGGGRVGIVLLLICHFSCSVM